MQLETDRIKSSPTTLSHNCSSNLLRPLFITEYPTPREPQIHFRAAHIHKTAFGDNISLGGGLLLETVPNILPAVAASYWVFCAHRALITSVNDTFYWLFAPAFATIIFTAYMVAHSDCASQITHHHMSMFSASELTHAIQNIVRSVPCAVALLLMIFQIAWATEDILAYLILTTFRHSKSGQGAFVGNYEKGDINLKAIPAWRVFALLSVPVLAAWAFLSVASCCAVDEELKHLRRVVAEWKANLNRGDADKKKDNTAS